MVSEAAEREPVTEDNREAAMSGPDITEAEHEVMVHAERPVMAREKVPFARGRQETRAAVGAGPEGPAATLADHVPGRQHGGTVRLEQRELVSLLCAPRDLARRGRGLFLFGAALAGVLVGCLTRGATGGRRRGYPAPNGPSEQ